jgi:hypothetical protein
MFAQNSIPDRQRTNMNGSQSAKGCSFEVSEFKGTSWNAEA